MVDLNRVHSVLHFGQLPAATQLAHFYTCTLTPVSPGMHQAAITLDEEHGYRISNPAYQLFCALVLQDFELMNLADAVLDDPRLHGLIDAHRFPPALKREVVRELAWHTSHRGFVEGAHWRRIRGRCARLLALLNLGPAPQLPIPFKFQPFLYPDDVAVYNPYPDWQPLGQRVSRAHWQVLRAQVAEDYRHDRLRHPVAGFGRSD